MQTACTQRVGAITAIIRRVKILNRRRLAGHFSVPIAGHFSVPLFSPDNTAATQFWDQKTGRKSVPPGGPEKRPALRRHNKNPYIRRLSGPLFGAAWRHRFRCHFLVQETREIVKQYPQFSELRMRKNRFTPGQILWGGTADSQHS